MSEVEIYKELTRVFHDVFDDESIFLTPGTSQADIDGWDSFNQIRLVVSIESAFGVKFITRDLQKMETVGDMVKLIQQRAPVPV